MAGLFARLEAKGLGLPLVRIESDQIIHADQLMLSRHGGSFRIVETDRGQVLEEYCRCNDESEAAEAFALQLARRSVFLGSFANEKAASRLRNLLGRAGIRSWSSCVPNLPDTSSSYCLHVPTMQWRRAQEIMAGIDSRVGKK